MTTLQSRELDAKVAEIVMGGKYEHVRGYGDVEFDEPQKDQPIAPDSTGKNVRYEYLPFYSSNIAAAWQVVEKMNFFLCPQWRPGAGQFCKRTGWAVYKKAEDLAQDICEMPGDARSLAVAETAPLAVCLAALRAHGVEV